MTGAGGAENAPRQTLPVLRCFAGDLALGLAADQVLEFLPAEVDVPHIAAALGLPPGPPGPGQRTLRLRAARTTVSVNVDGPVQVRPLGAADVLPLPAYFLRAPIDPVMGFAEENGRIVLLLDVETVASKVSAKHAANEGTMP